jgi:hypothetical protein
MLMLQKMNFQLLFGKVFEYQKIKFLIFEKMIIGGLLVQHDLVVQILKYFIGFEKVNFHQKKAMFEMMKAIGWKSGIMFLWNTIGFQMEN